MTIPLNHVVFTDIEKAPTYVTGTYLKTYCIKINIDKRDTKLIGILYQNQIMKIN